ncbi:3-oxoacyl-ACP reductase [Rhodococcus sp. ACS1]|uniref:SDR family oxidoreductase n=1 Tax=Rhodococcus sp. ACS1 TaxID=2028570 RepID=UPI000BB1658D|nr:SDR family oxidoreductase [Rhodococcus sp. ACS1]PBC35357.1 3-oxoacyl-ACP reductase [Rhodococcus sp. ACS1]
MTGDLSGRVALITGGSRGIGKAIAAKLADAGAQVVIASRKAEVCAAAAQEIGHGCGWIAANVGSPEDAERSVTQVVEQYGAVDILINNAATNPYLGHTIEIDLPRWQKVLQVNLTAPLVWTQLAWQQSMQQSVTQSAVLNVSSVGGYWTSPDHGAYDVSKAALMHLTKQLAAELGPAARVNALAPGLTRTDFNTGLFEQDGAEAAIAAKYPLKRLGTVADMASVAHFLVSDDAGWITGQSLLVDGGGIYGFERTG